MRSIQFKRTLTITALAVTAMFGLSTIASAQLRRPAPTPSDQYGSRKDPRTIKTPVKTPDRNDRGNDRWDDNDNERRMGGVFMGGNANLNSNRYRVNRGGRNYNIDQRAAAMLRQAVNDGYRQGFTAGQADSRRHRRYNWQNNNTYRSGTYGYQAHVDRGLYQYYFQQGFEKGYQDGFYSRQQYGVSRNGSTNIFEAILGSILNLKSY